MMTACLSREGSSSDRPTRSACDVPPRRRSFFHGESRPAVAASEQQAKAWFNFGVGSSTSANISWGGRHGNCGRGSEPWPQHAMGTPNSLWYGPAPAYPQVDQGFGGYAMPGGHDMPGGH